MAPKKGREGKKGYIYLSDPSSDADDDEDNIPFRRSPIRNARPSPTPEPEADPRLDEETQKAWAKEDKEDAKQEKDKAARKKRKYKAMKSQDTTPSGITKRKKRDNDPDAGFRPTIKVKKGWSIY